MGISTHRYLFRTSAVPVLDRHFSQQQVITYHPPGDAGSFTVDGAVGDREYLDEQATGSDYELERMRIRLRTDDLKDHDVHSLQPAAIIEINETKWNLSYSECWMGEEYTVLQLIRNLLYRRNQMRST